MLYGLLSFLGAFALFLFEPFLGKVLTPRFGGGAQVWIVCMLFFQLALLGGYVYAHLLGTKVPPRRQAKLHAGLLFLVVAAMGWAWLRHGNPLIPPQAADAGDPTFGVLGTLASVAGLPMLALAATSPLVQLWYSRAQGERTPYKLYVWSNAGSLAGLLAYPFLAEPWLSTPAQGLLIFALVAVFALGMAFLGGKLPAATEAVPESGVEAGRRFEAPHWILAAAAGAMLLMAATNKLTLETAAIPLLWILPLLLYLFSFILIFDAERGLSRGWWPALWCLLFAACLWLEAGGLPQGRPWMKVLAASGLTFSGCMLCHGELFEARPGPARLTRFYLCVALGGALGGVFVALLAPLCFDHLYELGLAACLAGGLGLFMAKRLAGPRRALQALLALLCLGLAGRFVWKEGQGEGVYARNFYGVVHVQRQGAYLSMDNLKTLHGFVDLQRPDVPLAYYTPDSGIGRALLFKMTQRPGPLKVGVVGLGAGAVADYGRPGDSFTFYEINPVVSALAGPRSQAFGLLRNSKAQVELLEGDGRILLEQELRAGAPRGFDVLLVDAFSGDAVPWHLLTVEAFRAYLAHLAPGGLLVLHVSNPLPVDRIVLDDARAMGLYGVYLMDPGPRAGESYPPHMPSQYMVLARESEALRSPVFEGTLRVGFGPKTFEREAVPGGSFAFMAKDRPWTDSRNSLSQLLFQKSAAMETR